MASVRIEVHQDLKKVLEDLRLSVAGDMKKQFNLSTIEVPRTISSQILAAKHQGKKILHYKIRKTSADKGVLELI